MRPAPVRQQVALTPTIPAPMGGLNARDSLAAMPPQDASVFTNLFAETTRIRTRAGYVTFSTATSIGIVNQYEGFNALLTYQDRLFALFGYYVSSGGAKGKARIYEVNTTSGALTLSGEIVTVAAVDLLQLGEWAQFTTGAGTTHLLVMYFDDTTGVRVRSFDGTSWSNLTITNVTGGAAPLTGIHAHRGRLWFYRAPSGTKSLSAYYLPTGAIQGTAVEFSIGQFATKGGYIESMRTWTVDNGEGGSDDVAVFVTSKGQAIIYSGNNPASASTWQLVGVFNVADVAVLATNPSVAITLPTSGTFKDSVAMKYGADVLLLLQDGVTSAGRVTNPQDDENDYSLSAKIRPLIAQELRTQSIYFPKLVAFEKLNQLFVNIVTAVTQSGGGAAVINQTYTSVQYVMNTETGSWAKFDSMNMKDAVALGGNLYFTDGAYTIKKYDGTAASDAGNSITWECRQAYNYFENPNYKLSTLVRPFLRSTGDFAFSLQADADFNPGSISTYTSYTIASEASVQPVISPSKYGQAFAAHLKGQSSAGVVSWYSTSWAFQPGGFL